LPALAPATWNVKHCDVVVASARDEAVFPANGKVVDLAARDPRLPRRDRLEVAWHRLGPRHPDPTSPHRPRHDRVVLRQRSRFAGD
jgi:hypothetical protein